MSEILTIINGTASGENYETVKRFGFYCGFQVCTLDNFLSSKENRRERDVLFCLDLRGMEAMSTDVLQVLHMHCPIIMIPGNREEMKKLKAEYGSFCRITRTPLSLREFRDLCYGCIEETLLEQRNLCFGRLVIDRSGREIKLDGQAVEVTGYEFAVFLFLAEHMGEVFAREEINRYLLDRKRDSLRNVDTHVKKIRKCLGVNDVIKCVRTVGYYVSPESLYEAFQD